MSPLVLQGIASGIVTGCVYALIAISLVIVYKSSDVINFAGGEMVMLGGYLGMFALIGLGLPYLLIFPFAAVSIFVIGALFDRVVLTRTRRLALPGQSALVAMVIGTVGLSYVIKGAVRVVPYTEDVRRLPPISSGTPIFLGPVVLQHQDVAIVLAAIVIMIALWAFFSLTMTGKALRATSQNPRAASLVGIPVPLMSLTAWGLAAALAGVAGVLLAPKLLLTPDSGIVVILALAAAIIGGFTSLPGCVAGGILLGVVQNLIGIFVSSRAISLAPFLVIMLVLLIRPQGLFAGKVTAKKV
ncbi:MAG: branched-chain amino acid ABC transporter permease [Alphaproteobacteria bacterium]|nr:branched-chain amino acid ABC transporter permease [Alphaproteobacteria bacterium]